MPLAPYRLKRKQRHSELGLRSCLLSYVLVWYVTVMPLAHYRSKKKVQWARSVLMLTEWQAMPLSCYWHIPVKKKFCDLGLHSCSLTSVVAWYAPGMLLSCYRQITGYTKKYSKLGLHSCSLSSVLVWYATVMLLTHCRLKKTTTVT